MRAAWQMPQGGIDDRESPREAAMRELKEEIGTNNAEIIAESGRWPTYDVPEEFARKAWSGRWKGQRQKWFVMLFKGEIGTNNAEIIAESGRWPTYDVPEEFARKAWSGRWKGQRQKWFVMLFK